MVGIVAVLVLVSLSLIVTRLGASALEATGMSHGLAHFQARSAFTGVGYTTAEAESVARHPVRRKIVLTLMLLGNAGIVSVIASLVLGFSDAGGRDAALRLGVLVVGLLLLWAATNNERVDRAIKALMRKAIARWTDVEVRDYVQLLDVSGDYAVRDIQVDEGDWLAGADLRGLDLPAEGVLVLGIRRANGSYLGAPAPDSEINAGDTVVLYGRESSLDELEDRPHGPTGDAEHEQGAARQDHVQAAEQARDRSAEADRQAVELGRNGERRRN